MSLSLISEAYFLASDSELGCGEDDGSDGGDGNKCSFGTDVQTDLCKVKDEGGKVICLPVEEKVHGENYFQTTQEFGTVHVSGSGPLEGDSETEYAKELDSSIHLNNLHEDSKYAKRPGANETPSSEVISSSNNPLSKNATGISSTPKTGDPFMVAVNRKRKNLFRNWISMYRKTGRSGCKSTGKILKLKRKSKVGGVVNHVGGQDPGRRQVEDKRQTFIKMERFKCPYCLETIIGRDGLIKHLEIHQQYDSVATEASPSLSAMTSEATLFSSSHEDMSSLGHSAISTSATKSVGSGFLP